ncbi:hypothetical protein Tco_0681910 [Tanacetum coccineum]|uniref:Uncharacterized protein n=1 Tax=Tanacetum coccineum TaxID=301880 RepID=A0ABQ4XQD4_9ASTR
MASISISGVSQKSLVDHCLDGFWSHVVWVGVVTRGKFPNVFSLKINHGGVLISCPNRHYKGGEVNWFDHIDSDEFSVVEIRVFNLYDIGMNVEWVGCNEAEVKPSVEFQDEESVVDEMDGKKEFLCRKFGNKEIIKQVVTQLSVDTRRELHLTRNDLQRVRTICRGQIPVFTTESLAMFMDSGLKDVSGLKDTTWLKESCGPSGDASGSKLVKRKKTKVSGYVKKPNFDKKSNGCVWKLHNTKKRVCTHGKRKQRIHGLGSLKVLGDDFELFRITNFTFITYRKNSYLHYRQEKGIVPALAALYLAIAHRPRKKRIKIRAELMDNMAKGGKLSREEKLVTCRICKQVGHNQRSCKSQINHWFPIASHVVANAFERPTQGTPQTAASQRLSQVTPQTVASQRPSQHTPRAAKNSSQGPSHGTSQVKMTKQTVRRFSLVKMTKSSAKRASPLKDSDDMWKAYEEGNDILQEKRALIDTFLKEESDKDYEMHDV